MYRLLLSAAAAAFLTTGAAQATVVSYDFWLFDAADNSLISTDGVLSYDDAFVSAVGSSTLNPVSGGASLSFTADGVAYTEANDTDYPTFPQFSFEFGDLVFIDYKLADGVNGVDFSGYDFTEAWFDSIEPVPSNAGLEDTYFIYVATNAIPAVPLPAGAPLVASAFGLLGFLRRKKKNAA